jgi:hypothetical protein
MSRLLKVIDDKINILLKYSRFKLMKAHQMAATPTFFTKNKEDKSSEIMKKYEQIPLNKPVQPDPDYVPPKSLPSPIDDW